MYSSLSLPQVGEQWERSVVSAGLKLLQKNQLCEWFIFLPSP